MVELFLHKRKIVVFVVDVVSVKEKFSFTYLAVGTEFQDRL